jgi:hypothetical protein
MEIPQALIDAKNEAFRVAPYVYKKRPRGRVSSWVESYRQRLAILSADWRVSEWADRLNLDGEKLARELANTGTDAREAVQLAWKA